MGATVGFGITSMLPHNMRHKEKKAFLSEFTSFGISSYFLEGLTNTHDPGSSLEIYLATYDNNEKKVDRQQYDDAEAFVQLWRKALPITFNYWSYLEHIDVFLPNFLEEGIVAAYVPELRRNINIASIAHGKTLIVKLMEQKDRNLKLFGEVISGYFDIAEQNNFIVCIF